MKVYITKYAFTQGIYEVDVRQSSATRVTATRSVMENYHYSEWHLTRAEAEQQAEKMRLAKIKSLEKQLDKLRRLSFKEAELKVEK